MSNGLHAIDQYLFDSEGFLVAIMLEGPCPHEDQVIGGEADVRRKLVSYAEAQDRARQLAAAPYMHLALREVNRVWGRLLPTLEDFERDDTEDLFMEFRDALDDARCVMAEVIPANGNAVQSVAAEITTEEMENKKHQLLKAMGVDTNHAYVRLGGRMIPKEEWNPWENHKQLMAVIDYINGLGKDVCLRFAILINTALAKASSPASIALQAITKLDIFADAALSVLKTEMEVQEKHNG